MAIQLNRVLGQSVKRISADTTISQHIVESVLYTFITHLVDVLGRERKVVIPGITSIKLIRDRETGEYFARGRVSSTLRDRLNSVHTGGTVNPVSTNYVIDLAINRGIPATTVDTILRHFIDILLESAITTGAISIPCLTTITVVKQADNNYVTRGRISPALQSMLRGVDIVA